MDSAYEIRSMILASTPYPPLPVVVSQVEDMTVGQETVTTSHAVLSQCLQTAAVKNDDKANKDRQRRQIEVFQRFLHGLAESGFDLSGGELYDFYCRHTKLHLETYFDGKETELRFMPLSYIAKGDQVHQRMCEYMAAQSILFKDPVPKDVSQFLTKSYAYLLELARDRLGHTMTDEEREMADRMEQEAD